jgi:hypothetical protein
MVVVIVLVVNKFDVVTIGATVVVITVVLVPGAVVLVNNGVEVTFFLMRIQIKLILKQNLKLSKHFFNEKFNTE